MQKTKPKKSPNETERERERVMDQKLGLKLSSPAFEFQLLDHAGHAAESPPILHI